MQTFSKQEYVRVGMFIALCTLFGAGIFGEVLHLGPFFTELATVFGTLLALKTLGPRTLGMEFTMSKFKKLG